MKIYAYSLHDSKTGFQPPTFAYSDQAAIRDFGNAVLSHKGLFANYAADFTLYKIGYFDSDGGTLQAFDPESLVNGMSFLHERGDDNGE